MAFAESEFEIKDNQGSSVPFNGTATTTPQNIPAVAGNVISGFVLSVDGQNVEVSTDGGSNYYAVPRNGSISWDVKGEITQIQVRTSSGSTGFSGIVNLEDY